MSINIQALLQGRYEAERLPGDFSPERIVPDFAFNVLNPLGLLYRPVVDEDYLARGGTKPVWPDGKPFAVCLTHDVDLVSLYSLRQSSRGRRATIMNGSTPASPVKAIRGLVGWGLDAAWALVRAGMAAARTSGGAYAAVSGAPRGNATTDPLHCYERWLAVEAQVGACSTFFFWPGWKAVGRHHPSDCLYDMEDRVVFDGGRCTVAEMIREIDRRGWEIGLHPSWYSFDDEEEMKRQKAALEGALGRDVVSVRQHYLHYDIRVTPRVQAAAGLQYDATLGFNDNVGFRFGTCYPWRLWDLGGASSAEADAPATTGASSVEASTAGKKADLAAGTAAASGKTVADLTGEAEVSRTVVDATAATQLPIIEIPLIIQDGGLLNPVKGMRLDEETAFQYVQQIAAEVERVGGVLTLLWHPNAVANPPWWSLYLRTLEYLHQRGAWFGSVREIGETWKAQG